MNKISLTFPVIALVLSSCAAPYNDWAMEHGAPPVEDGNTILNIRSVQTRSFNTLETTRLVAAGTQAMQDLGFTIVEASSEMGVLVGEKYRDATESDQVAGQIALVILFAALGSSYNPVWDEEQKIFATLVVQPTGEQGTSEMRISIDRRIWNNQKVLWKTEVILDPEVYKEFFDKIGQAAFLEAHQI